MEIKIHICQYVLAIVIRTIPERVGALWEIAEVVKSVKVWG